jgi:shikimate kinase
VARVVILLGPPGSGKTTVGEELARRGMAWRDVEAELRRRWGSRDRFLERKAEALPVLHAELLGWIGGVDVPAVVESTGLSDAPLLDEIERAHDCLIVRLAVSERAGLARVAARAPGRHLTDDPRLVEPVRRAFDEFVVPTRRVHLVLDTEERTPSEVVDVIVAALATG